MWPAPGQPHVQSYAVATDVQGLAVLRSAPSVFACHKVSGVLWQQLW